MGVDCIVELEIFSKDGEMCFVRRDTGEPVSAENSRWRSSFRLKRGWDRRDLDSLRVDGIARVNAPSGAAYFMTGYEDRRTLKEIHYYGDI